MRVCLKLYVCVSSYTCVPQAILVCLSYTCVPQAIPVCLTLELIPYEMIIEQFRQKAINISQNPAKIPGK